MSFLRLDSDERIVLVLRRHWIVLARDITTSTFLAVLAIPLWALLPQFLPALQLAPYREMMLTGVMLYLAFVWIGFFLNWVDYYLDVWIITTKRVVDVEQRGLFSREASEFRIARIQDITTEIHGVLQTFMDFGDVHVQTAGEGREFVFKQVPDPNRAKELLLNKQKLLENDQRSGL